MVCVAVAASAQGVKVMNLWPKKAPNNNGDPRDTAKVWIYLPEAKKATGRAIVICPGGGYSGLAMSHEGHEWGKFFQNNGIAAFVLKYRMPHGRPEVPISDAEETIRMVRRNASTWHHGLVGRWPLGFHNCHPIHQPGEAKFPNSLLSCHYHDARLYASRVTRQFHG